MQMQSDVGVLHYHPSMNNQWLVVAQCNPIFTSTAECSAGRIPGYWLLDTDPKLSSYICAESINLVQPAVSPPENLPHQAPADEPIMTRTREGWLASAPKS